MTLHGWRGLLLGHSQLTEAVKAKP
jgi:hypothetical protein